MAERGAFLQSGSYSAEDLRQAFGIAWANDGGVDSLKPIGGVIRGDGQELLVEALSLMTVKVNSGRALVPGTSNPLQGAYPYLLDTDKTITVAAANATNPRKDIIVVRVQDAAYSGATNLIQAEIVAGTPAATPALPATPASSIVLAEILVDANATVISTAKITDRRTFATLRGGAAPGQLCPSGALMPFAGAAAPVGWLLAAGQSLPRSAYPDLFTAIGIIYGAVDGNSFTLPNLSGRVALGAGLGAGLTQRNLASQGGIQDSPVPYHGHAAYAQGVDTNHSHAFTTGGQSAGHTHTTGTYARGVYQSGGGTTARDWDGRAGPDATAGGSADHSHSGGTGWQSADHGHNVVVTGAGGTPTDYNMQPYVALNYIIKT
jgi:microcystin-dependent protein